MLNIILNLVGIILIIYSIYVIRKDLSEKVSFNEKYESNEEVHSIFKELIEYKLEEIKEENKVKSKNEINSKINDLEIKKLDEKTINNKNVESKISKVKLDPAYKKIIELLDIGLTKEEIAKKLNKGIREIEIIIKLHGN